MRGESGGGDGERPGTGREIGEGEVAVGGGDDDARGLGVEGEGDAGGGDGVAVDVGDGAGEGGGLEGCGGGFGGEGALRSRNEDKRQGEGTQAAGQEEGHLLHFQVAIDVDVVARGKLRWARERGCETKKRITENTEERREHRDEGAGSGRIGESARVDGEGDSMKRDRKSTRLN